MNSHVIGMSFGYHDSAVAILRDGEIVAAAQEERFSRIKQDSRFPRLALRFCLDHAGIKIDQVDEIFYYENPLKKLGRITSTFLNFGPRGYRSFMSDMPAWLGNKVHVRRTIISELKQLFETVRHYPRISYIDHHESHAASAFFASPYRDAAILCIDGVGEWATTSAWSGDGSRLSPLWEMRFPHSLGLLYSAFTYFCGFKVDSGEYKLMGLAPYGRPIYAQKILDHLIDVKPDGSFWMNMAYFDYATGNRMISDRFEALFGGPRREPEGPITEREFDLAASVQAVLEEVVLRLARSLRKQTSAANLCLAGGVALNCVSNGKLMHSKVFDSIWVQPASGDSGGALGAALAGWHIRMRRPRAHIGVDQMKATLLGSSYGDAQIESQLAAFGAKFTKLESSELFRVVARLLAEGNVIGWFQGRMEFGPRALGARSIIGDARNSSMQKVMNLKIKNRESFRPFAPVVLEELAHEWFDLDRPSPYMLFVVDVHGSRRLIARPGEGELQGIDKLNCLRSTIPAVTHVDYSARVQTVSPESNPTFYELVREFHSLTGCPVLVNTSFNVRGEPIVESPANAYTCFMRTQMDCLVVGPYLMHKIDQPEWKEARDWRHEFALD